MKVTGPIAAIGTVIIVVTSIAIPNFREAINRSRQKRTMKGVRDWAIALENVRHRPVQDSRTIVGLSTQLVKLANSRNLSSVDGWGHPYRIRMRGASYLVQSSGRDGIFEQLTSVEAIHSYDNDIGFANGAFIRYPEGL